MLAGGEVLRATTVVSSADPSRLRALIGDARLPIEYQRRVDGFVRGGSVAKVSLVLSELPRFTALAEDRGQHRATIHLVPHAGEGAIEAMSAAFERAQEGFLPAAPSIEMMLPLEADSGASDAEGHHHASLLVPMAPYDLAGTTWAAEEDAFAKSVLGVIDAFAPGTSDRVVDMLVLSPKKLESHFGVTRGQLHHVDDAVIFGDRLAYATPIGGVYACGAGCAPAGGVFALAGHNAAKRVLADMELGLERTEVGAKF
jgi:phytoene dehydrogenase-like protein